MADALPNISHLIDPKCFLTLPSQNPPHPFPVNPPSDISDPYSLYTHRFYRHAADLCKEQLIAMTAPINTHDTISKVFRLWAIRLSSLFMIRMSGIARDECQAFGDLGDDIYRIPSTRRSIVPWNLQLLVVRIQAGGCNQQAIGQYYTLLREARANTQREKVFFTKLLSKKKNLKSELAVASSSEHGDADSSKKEKLEKILAELETSINDTRVLLAKWKARVRHLGLFIAAMLMGMHDTKTASSLLQSLYMEKSKVSMEEQAVDDENKESNSIEELAKQISTNDSAKELASFLDKVVFTQAMLYLQIGDTISSRQWFAKLKNSSQPDTSSTPSFSSAVILGNAMCAIADADWDEAEKLLSQNYSNKNTETIQESESGGKVPAADLSTRKPFQVALANNLSITKTNQANILASIDILQDLVFQGNVISPAIMTNLSILYDLRQEAGRRMKNRLLVELKNQGYLALENYDFLQ